MNSTRLAPNAPLQARDSTRLAPNEVWNATEQRRHFRIEGDRLYIESEPAPSIVFPGKTDYRRLVWERDK